MLRLNCSCNAVVWIKWPVSIDLGEAGPSLPEDKWVSLPREPYVRGQHDINFKKMNLSEYNFKNFQTNYSKNKNKIIYS